MTMHGTTQIPSPNLWRLAGLLAFAPVWWGAFATLVSWPAAIQTNRRLTNDEDRIMKEMNELTAIFVASLKTTAKGRG